MGNPRRANGHRRDSARRIVRSWGGPCAICRMPIDYSLPPGTPWSFEVDEIVPVSKGGSPYDPASLQPAHRRCNQWRSNRSMSEVAALLGRSETSRAPAPPVPSTDW